MRTLILSIACFTVTVLTAQQNDLAFLDSNTIGTKSMAPRNYKTTFESPNSIYLNERSSVQPSIIVKQWREKLANYDLKGNSIFDNSEKATYQVKFKNEQVHIIADYDNNGKILSTKETYKNIKIPLELRVKISKEHPECLFLKTSFHLNYSHKNGIDKQYYKVQIRKENKNTSLKFDINFNAI